MHYVERTCLPCLLAAGYLSNGTFGVPYVGIDPARSLTTPAIVDGNYAFLALGPDNFYHTCAVAVPRQLNGSAGENFVSARTASTM